MAQVKRFDNPPELRNAFGDPYTMAERRCPPTCTGAGCSALHEEQEHCTLDARTMVCAEPTHLHKEVKPLASWLRSIMVNLPRQRLTMADITHAYGIMRACNRALDRRSRSVAMDARDYDWLVKTLFDDEAGKKLATLTGPDGREIPGSGALVVALTDPWLGATLRRLVMGLEEEEPPSLDTVDTDGNEPEAAIPKATASPKARRE